MTDITRQIGDMVVSAAILAVGGLAAYVYEHARAGAFGAHFGVGFVAADPREATFALVSVAIVALTLVGTVWLSLRAAEVTVLAAVAVVAVGAALISPLDVRSVTESATVLGIFVVMALMLRWVWRTMRADLPVWPRERVERLRRALKVPPLVLLLAMALAVLWAAWRFGAAEGRRQAGENTVFDLVRRDPTSVTVIFTRHGDIVERVLDITPDANGNPRNEWMPGVVIRPMPEDGIRYETVRLGKTRPSRVGPP